MSGRKERINQTIPLYKEPTMKNRFVYALGVIAIAFGIFAGGADIRQSPPDPTCPFDQWPCTAMK